MSDVEFYSCPALLFCCFLSIRGYYIGLKIKFRIPQNFFIFIFFQKCVNDTDARTHAVTTHTDAPIHNSSKGSKGVCTSGSPTDPNPQFPDGALFHAGKTSQRPHAVKGLVLPPHLNGERKLSEDTSSLFEHPLLSPLAQKKTGPARKKRRTCTPFERLDKLLEKSIWGETTRTTGTTRTTETKKTSPTPLPLPFPWTPPVPIPVVEKKQQQHFGVCSPPFPVLVGLSHVPVQEKQQKQQQQQTKIDKPGPKDQKKMIPAMPMARAMPIAKSIQLQRPIIVSAKPCNDDTLEDAIHLYNQGEYVPALSILQNLANMILSVRLHNKKPSANHCNTHCMILMYTGMVYVKLHRIKDAIEQFKWVSSHRRALNGVRMPNDNIFQTAHALEQKLSKRGEHFNLRKDIAEIVDK